MHVLIADISLAVAGALGAIAAYLLLMALRDGRTLRRALQRRIDLTHAAAGIHSAVAGSQAPSDDIAPACRPARAGLRPISRYCL